MGQSSSRLVGRSVGRSVAGFRIASRSCIDLHPVIFYALFFYARIRTRDVIAVAGREIGMKPRGLPRVIPSPRARDMSYPKAVLRQKMVMRNETVRANPP